MLRFCGTSFVGALGFDAIIRYQYGEGSVDDRLPINPLDQLPPDIWVSTVNVRDLIQSLPGDTFAGTLFVNDSRECAYVLWLLTQFQKELERVFKGRVLAVVKSPYDGITYEGRKRPLPLIDFSGGGELSGMAEIKNWLRRMLIRDGRGLGGSGYTPWGIEFRIGIVEHLHQVRCYNAHREMIYCGDLEGAPEPHKTGFLNIASLSKYATGRDLQQTFDEIAVWCASAEDSGTMMAHSSGTFVCIYPPMVIFPDETQRESFCAHDGHTDFGFYGFSFDGYGRLDNGLIRVYGRTEL